MRTFTLKNVIWPKRAAYELKTAFCIIFMGSALFFRFEGEFEASFTILRTLTAQKLRFGQNVLRMTWKERLVQFLWKALCFPFWRENLRPVWRFWELWRSKLRFGQNVLRMSWKERFVQFLWKAPLFSRFGENFRPLWGFWELWKMVKNVIWPKHAPHHLKRAFCTIFMESALFSYFEARIWCQCEDFENFVGQNCDLAKRCCACPEKSVLYNFDGKRSVFPFWREF